MFRPVPVLFLAALLLAAGCAEKAPSSVVASGNLAGSVTKLEDHWNTGLGCYWRVYGAVYATGDTGAKDVVAYVQLIDTLSGNIRDARAIALGDLGKGDSRSFEVSLDGECERKYRVEVRPVEGR